jgi:hypothetical protein
MQRPLSHLVALGLALTSCGIALLVAESGRCISMDVQPHGPMWRRCAHGLADDVCQPTWWQVQVEGAQPICRRNPDHCVMVWVVGGTAYAVGLLTLAAALLSWIGFGVGFGG